MNSKQRRTRNRKWKYVATLNTRKLEFHEEEGRMMNMAYVACTWIEENLGAKSYVNENTIRDLGSQAVQLDSELMYCVNFRFQDKEKYEWFLLRFGNDVVQQSYIRSLGNP